MKPLQEFETISTLGLAWNLQYDRFFLKLDLNRFKKVSPAKRLIFLDIARLFDPGGWYAPALIMAKMLIQNLWLVGINWDQSLTPSLLKQ